MAYHQQWAAAKRERILFLWLANGRRGDRVLERRRLGCLALTISIAVIEWLRRYFDVTGVRNTNGGLEGEPKVRN